MLPSYEVLSFRHIWFAFFEITRLFVSHYEAIYDNSVKTLSLCLLLLVGLKASVYHLCSNQLRLHDILGSLVAGN